jgi:hypothetical protein
MARRSKDGVDWTVGTQAEVDWITEGTGRGPQITGAIPPIYSVYATLVNAGKPDLPRDTELERRQDRAFVDVLRRHDRGPWWLGYLDTEASDIVFWDAPKVTVYSGWNYVLVLAGPEQAASWRPAPAGHANWKSTELPELMFPTDRSWLVSFLWDDDWACVGAADALISDLEDDPVLAGNARRVDPGQDAAPPGDWPG